MHSFIPFVVACVFGNQALAATHHMFSGVFSGTDIYAIEFDDEANTLTLANSITSQASSSKWIAIDERKQNIYVGNGAQYDSYSINNSTSLTYTSSVYMSSTCSNANYLLASTSTPHVVYGAAYSTGCPANMMSVDSTGALTGTILANASYSSASGVHGLALSSDNEFLYSADDMGNAIWVHSVNGTSGEISEVQKLDAPTGADPRHMVVHPGGGYAYVVFEALSEIGVYSRDTGTGELTYTNASYPLLPTGYTNTSSYWADEVMFSVNTNGTPSYMYAATRSRTTTIPGYVSAFSINTETGAVKSQLFLAETTASGGSANSVTSAPFAEEYFAITDSAANSVEVWQITMSGADSATGKAVAHLDLAAGPSDVVWFD